MIGLDRAERNAINDEVIAAIERAVEHAQEKARAIVLYGNGPAFARASISSSTKRGRAEEVFHHSRSWHRAFRKLRHGRVTGDSPPSRRDDRRVVLSSPLPAICASRTAPPSSRSGRLARHLCRGRRLRACGASDRRFAHGRHDAHRSRARRGDRGTHGPRDYLSTRAKRGTRRSSSRRRSPWPRPHRARRPPGAARIQDMSEDDGLFVESLMAALSETGPEAARRLAEFAQKRGAKVKGPE